MTTANGLDRLSARARAAQRFAPRRRVTALAVAAAVALVGAATTLVPVGATAAAAGATDSTPPALTLIAQSSWIGPTGTFHLKVVTPLPAGGDLVARIYVPISTQSQLADVAQGESLGDVVERVTVPAAQFTRAADGSVQLDYPFVASGSTPTYGFHLSNPGVYPFELTVVDADGNVTGQLSTQLIRLPAVSSESSSSGSSSAASRLALSLVVPFGAPLGRSPLHDPELAPTTLASLAAESALLARYQTVPAALAPVPETVDTLADHDRTVGTNSIKGLQAAIGSRKLVGSTYVPLDSGAWLAHGLADGYDRQLTAGSSTLSSQLGVDPLPDVALTDATTTSDVLTADFAHGTREVVVASNHLADTNGDQTDGEPLTQWFDLATSHGDRIQAVPTDAALDTQLSVSRDPILAAHRVLAALALTALDHSGSQACVRPSDQSCRRGLAIVLPANAARALPALQVLLAALSDPTGEGAVDGLPSGSSASHGAATATALVAPVGIREFLYAVDPSAESGVTNSGGAHQLRQLASHPVASLGSFPTQFTRVSHELASFTSMVVGLGPTAGTELASSWNELVLASGAIELSAPSRALYLSHVESDLTGQTSQIIAPSQQTVTLTSASGRIPFSLSNPLPYPVRVALVFQSPKLHFVAGNTQIVLLPAKQPRHLQIAVTARASGAFPMQVTVMSPDQGMTITQTHFDVRSTAISSIGLALTLAAGVFLLLWWARNLRNGRRRRGLVDSNHPALRA